MLRLQHMCPVLGHQAVVMFQAIDSHGRGSFPMAMAGSPSSFLARQHAQHTKICIAVAKRGSSCISVASQRQGVGVLAARLSMFLADNPQGIIYRVGPLSAHRMHSSWVSLP